MVASIEDIEKRIQELENGAAIEAERKISVKFEEVKRYVETQIDNAIGSVENEAEKVRDHLTTELKAALKHPLQVVLGFVVFGVLCGLAGYALKAHGF